VDEFRYKVGFLQVAIAAVQGIYLNGACHRDS